MGRVKRVKFIIPENRSPLCRTDASKDTGATQARRCKFAFFLRLIQVLWGCIQNFFILWFIVIGAFSKIKLIKSSWWFAFYLGWCKVIILLLLLCMTFLWFQSNAADDPKTAEYAFFQKLKEDAGRKFHSNPLPKQEKLKKLESNVSDKGNLEINLSYFCCNYQRMGASELETSMLSLNNLYMPRHSFRNL